MPIFLTLEPGARAFGDDKPIRTGDLTSIPCSMRGSDPSAARALVLARAAGHLVLRRSVLRLGLSMRTVCRPLRRGRGAGRRCAGLLAGRRTNLAASGLCLRWRWASAIAATIIEAGGVESALYAGHVMHQRMRPARHRLRYRVFSACCSTLTNCTGARGRDCTGFLRSTASTCSACTSATTAPATDKTCERTSSGSCTQLAWAATAPSCC